MGTAILVASIVGYVGEAVPLAALQSGRRSGRSKVDPVRMDLQAPSEYDKDYPKYENSDNGEWAAQMEYDQLRLKVRKDKEEADKAKGDMPAKDEKYKDEEAREQAISEK